MYRLGLILEIEKDKAVVLTNDNEYYYIKLRPHVEVGMKVTFSEYDIYKKKSYKAAAFKVVSIAASVVIALVIWFVAVNTKNLIGSTINRSVFAYMDIYCNSNIELVLDDNFEVMSVRGVNNEGIKTLKELDLLDKDYDKATEEFIKKSIELGYVNDEDLNDLILVSGALSPSNEREKNKEILSTHLEDITDIVYKVDYDFEIIEILEFESDIRHESYRKDISMGLYGVCVKGIEQGLDIDCKLLSDKKLDYLNEVNVKDNTIYEYKKPKVALKFDKEKIDNIDDKNLKMEVDIVSSNVKKIEVYLDDELVNMFETEPFVADFKNMKSGKHEIRTDLYLKNGYKLTEKRKIEVKDEDTNKLDENNDENNENEENKENKESKENEQEKDKTDDKKISSTFKEYHRWYADKIYDTGDIVKYDEKLWEAQWWTDGEVPGTTGEYGVWREYKVSN